MTRVPVCQPDGPKIRALIWDAGFSVAGYARSVGRNPGSLAGIVYKRHRASIEFMRPVARGLGVRLCDISNWTGPEESQPETAGRLSA